MAQRSKTEIEDAIYMAIMAFPAVQKQHARTALGRLEALYAELREITPSGD